MSTERELIILDLLHDAGSDTFYSAQNLADQLGVSVRTVKSDINNIKKLLSTNEHISIDSVASKGYKLSYQDELTYKELKEAIKNVNDNQELNNQKTRVNTIIYTLMNYPKGINKVKLMNSINVSESTLYQDIKEVKNIFDKYDLKLIYDFSKGYIAEGTEINKRRCLAYENIYWVKPEINDTFYQYVKHINEIKEGFIEICVHHKYRVSENILESMIIHFLLTATRIKAGFVIHDHIYDNAETLEEYSLAEEIMKHFLPVNSVDLSDEIKYFALNLHGKKELDSVYEIPPDINEFIDYALDRINQEFHVDFREMIDLKVALMLHFSPLLTRVESKKQLKNIMLSEIKLSFPFAFDIASFLSTLMAEEYHIQLSEDEIAYFTLYFNYGLDNISVNESGKKILIISSLRKSETILLKQRLLTWFKKEINTIDFCYPYEANKMNLSEYDALLTTEKDNNFNGAATKVDLFPTEKDYDRINIAINGYVSVDALIKKFSKDLFITGSYSDKTELIKKLIQMSKEKLHLDDKFGELVLQRESLSTTYFGNGVGIPHPLHPITEDTFVAVALLDNALEWNEEHTVNIVMLISTETGNPKAFQIWKYISELTGNKEAIEKISREKTYENFISVLKETLDKIF